jgi:hypothetical protein
MSAGMGGSSSSSTSSSSIPNNSHLNTSISRVGSISSSELSTFVNHLRSLNIQCVVFDLDRTLVSQHSGGCVPAEQLETFANSLTETSRILLPYLLENGFHIAVATFADDLYSQYAKGNVAGVTLVRRVLRECPCFGADTEQAKNALASVPIITINPDLYQIEEKRSIHTNSANSAAAAEEQGRMIQQSNISENSAIGKLRTFYHTKVIEFGIDSTHSSWLNVSSFPPIPFKNRHLELISSKLNIPIHSLLLIDDRDENCYGALEIGAHALFLTPPKKGLKKNDIQIQNIKKPIGKQTSNTKTTAATMDTPAAL